MFFLSALRKTINTSFQAIPGLVNKNGIQTVQIFIDDITHRKKAEKEILLAKDRYQTLFNASPIPMWEEDFTELKRYIKNEIPFNQTYIKPSNKSRSAGFYLPSYDKEKISIVVGIDTSGSIDKKELSEFMNEIRGINTEFSGRIEIRIITHDIKIHNN